MTNSSARKSLRSQLWFDNASDIGMTAMYLERYFNFGLTPEELKSGRPIIGIAQSGSELSPCNFIHTQIVDRVRDGIRDGGGIPLVFPVHPIQETGRRPTAALDRNLAYLGLVEILHGYPFDGVVLTTGCDKTTPAAIMAATTVDLPAIVLSGGPMLDSYWRGQMSGSGTTHWAARKLHAKGEMDEADHIDMAIGQVPSTGHCNTMGTALTMNSLAEGLGLSLSGCASIPAPYRDRAAMAYKTGKQAVTMVHEDLKPTRILTKKAFENAIALNTVLGGSTNAQIHINAIARHAGIDIDIKEWETHGYDLPLLVNLQPAGEYLGEAYHRAGGVPAVLWELDQTGKLHGDCITCDGGSIGDRVSETSDRRVILPFEAPMKKQAGFLVMSGNLFESAILKTSVIDEEFQKRFLEHPDHPGMFEGRVIVFEGSEDYHARINDPSLKIDETCILVIRQSGPVGWPGSAEVVNMQPPDYLLKQGINSLPTLGDGRQSGTSGSPSILHVTPESAVGGPFAVLQTNDKLRIDIPNRRVDILVPEEELEERLKTWTTDMPDHQTPWQQLYREHVGPLSTGGCFDFATTYSNVRAAVPRNNH